MRLEIVIPGVPVPYPRPRPSGGKQWYQPERYRVWAVEAQTAVYVAAVESRWPRGHPGPVAVRVVFRNPHPLADIDNLCKSVLEALQCNGIAIADDRQVTRLAAEKVRAPEEGALTRVMVETLD